MSPLEPLVKPVLSLHSAAAALRHALSDGEDFELCFCVAPKAAGRLPRWATQIGTVTDSGQLTIEWGDGRETLWLTGGFDHFRSFGA